MFQRRSTSSNSAYRTAQDRAGIEAGNAGDDVLAEECELRLRRRRHRRRKHARTAAMRDSRDCPREREGIRTAKWEQKYTLILELIQYGYGRSE